MLEIECSVFYSTLSKHSTNCKCETQADGSVWNVCDTDEDKYAYCLANGNCDTPDTCSRSHQTTGDFDQDGIDNECDTEGPGVEITEQSLSKVYKELPTPLPENSCNDGIDNDGDGLCDYEGCYCNATNKWCGTEIGPDRTLDPEEICTASKCDECGGTWWDWNLCDRDECAGVSEKCYFISYKGVAEYLNYGTCNPCTEETICEDYDDKITCVGEDNDPGTNDKYEDPCKVVEVVGICNYIDGECCVDNNNNNVCDKNEFYQRRCTNLTSEWWDDYHHILGDPGFEPPEYYACQPDPTDITICPKYSCVYNGTCYKYGDKLDIDGDGIEEVCKAP